MPDDEALATAKSRLGRVLRGKYRLDRVLGIGGMAVVYAATHRNKKRFAIKMLHPELSIRENIRTRFLREGYVANSVEHPGAVAVLDDDVAEDGSAFIVMELLEGAPVDEVWARQGKRLPLGTALAIGDALLDVLVAAHGKKIVHRDLKPANVFLTSDGRLEVLDFGIARLHDETSSEATATGQMLGTPAFMAPEQAMGESSKIDAQTDVWAVGATLFALLSGEFVHAGENASQLLIAAGTRPARPLGSVVKDVPASVVAVIDKALAFDKAQRWASAQKMRDALQTACAEATGSPIPPLPKTDAMVTGLEETIAPTSEGKSTATAFAPTVDSGAPTDKVEAAPRATGGRRPLPGLAILAVAVVLLGGIAASVMMRGKTRAAPAASSSAPASGPAPSTPAALANVIAAQGSSVYPCAETKRPLPPHGLDRTCSDDAVAWCSQSMSVVACCAAGLVPDGDEGACGCPASADPASAPAACNPTAPLAAGRLDPAEIQKIVRARFGAMRLCYEETLKRAPSATGKVAIAFEIDRAGGIFFARVEEGTLPDAKAQKCVLELFRGLHFPPPVGGVVSVVYPVVFSPGG
jgi:eukaryotic-like serine/threonine-protein kinase